MGIGGVELMHPWSDSSVERHRHRYYGSYLGFVRDRDDPAKCGRVRIHIPSILGEENNTDHWTDWALPSSAGLVVPPLGAPVWVDFEQGVVTHPRYSAGWLLGSDSSDSSAHGAGRGEMDNTWLSEKTVTGRGGIGPDIVIRLPADSARERRPKYPFNKVYLSEAGHVVELDDSTGYPRFRYVHPRGLTVLVDADGSLHFRGGGACYFEPGGDFNIALTQGSTFKVVYPDGTAMALGAQGFHVRGHQATLLGRTVERTNRNV